MNQVDEKFFCREIKHAHVICSVEHGFIVSMNNNNPYQKRKFNPEPNAIFHFWDNENGSVLKLSVDGVVKLVAFHLYDSSVRKHLMT